MNKNVIYLLVRNDPFALSELTSMLRRQERNDFDMVALVTGVPDGKLKTLLDQRLPDQIVVDDRSLARSITDDIARRAPATVTLLDTTYLPSNPVWFQRLLLPLESGEASVALSRLVHDLYTNWLIQNDFIHYQHQAKEHGPSPFLFPFGAVAFTPETLAKWPLPGCGFDDLLLQWGLAHPGPATLVHDALLTHLHPLTPGHYIGAHRRYARRALSPAGRLAYALKGLAEGIGRDVSFAWGRRRPQWIFYSIFFRIQKALSIVRTILS